MIPNKSRCLKPISTTEKRAYSDVNALRPHPPPVLTHIPKRRDGCSVCGSIPSFDMEPPMKKIPFRKATDNWWNRRWNQCVARHTGVVLPPLIQQKPRTPPENECLPYHHLNVHHHVRLDRTQEDYEEEDVRISIQGLEIEARIQKMTIQELDSILGQLNETIPELQIEIKNLEKKSREFEVLQHIPPKLQVSQRLVLSRKNKLDSIAVNLMSISKEITSSTEKLKKLKLRRKDTLLKMDEENKSLEMINLQIEALRNRHKDLIRTIRESVNRCGRTGNLDTAEDF